MLRYNGFFSSDGLAYFSKSKKSVPVRFDEPLIARRLKITKRKMPPLHLD